jgi:formylglycine-generating enzyme required for sulfatase activity
VCSFDPNGYGLCDMAGNVWEWVEDWYGPYSPGDQADPRGPSSGQYRVLRGGSWYGNFDDVLRCASRVDIDPGRRNGYVGFRCARGSE